MTLKARITAIDRFIKGCREDGIYDDLNACCVMAGWDSLAGALTPLKGGALTNSGFLAADFDRGIGLKGNGSTKRLSQVNTATPLQNSAHQAIYLSVNSAIAAPSLPTHIAEWPTSGSDGRTQIDTNTSQTFTRCRETTGSYIGSTSIGVIGISRSDSADYVRRVGQASETITETSTGIPAQVVYVFNNSSGSYSDATLAFYSIGTSLDLALLDARVSTLMADLRAIEEAGFDRDAIAYIRAVEEADGGAYLETSVKIAVNNLVSGLKADGLWDAIGSSCLLCGPRTLAGALVPLRGAAPTAYGFVDGDFDRQGLTGDGTSYLDSNRANNADPQDSKHFAVYAATATSAFGVYVGSQFDSVIYRSGSPDLLTRINRGTPFTAVSGAAGATGFLAANRPSLGVTQARAAGTTVTENLDAVRYISDNALIFATVSSGVVTAISDASLAFYSIGSSLDLAKLDSHISDYVTAIGAAI